MFYFNIVRLFLIIWSAVMISAIDSVAIREGGMIELENTSKDAYTKVLIVATTSFLGDGAYKMMRRR